MKAKTIFVISCLSILLAYLAFYNGYPLVTSDSGAYINNAFVELDMPAGRPITYSLFIRLSSLGYSLWLTVFTQGLLLAMLFYRLMKTLLPKQKNHHKSLIITVLSTVGFTSISWYTSQIMPDIFSPILILSVVLYFWDNFKYAKYLYPALIVLAALMHNSNLLMLFMFAVIAVAYAFFKQKELLRKTITLTALSVGALLFIATLHLGFGYGFTLSRSSHVFLMGKMCENGMLKTYLNDNCHKHNYKLCEYKDQLPGAAWEFVWNDSSPLKKMGGWDATKKEYSSILRDMAFSPRYYPRFAYKSIEHTLRQLAQIQVGDGLFPYRENTNPFWKVQENYNHELPEYLNSKQNMSKLDWKDHNSLYWIFLLLSTLAVFILSTKHSMPAHFKYAYLIIIIFIILNAFVTANLANVLARLSSRVVWLIPMMHIIYLQSIFSEAKSQIK